MQDMNKNGQTYQPIDSQKVQVDVRFMKKLVEDIERGQNSTHMIRNIILQHYPKMKFDDSYNNKNDCYYFKELDHHSMVALNTYATSISMLQSCDFDLGETGECKSEISFKQEPPKCYKKRKKGGESNEKEVTHLSDDGYAWRKYGQKLIHGYYHPRHYYRCTHKYEQKCEATKQIQQVSENPTKYKLIYNKNHTCNNKTSPYIINSLVDEHSSAIVLSFDGSNPINPMMFPKQTLFHNDNNTTTSEDTKDMMIANTSEVVFKEVVEDDYTPSTSTTFNLDEDYSSLIDEFYELFPDCCTTF